MRNHVSAVLNALFRRCAVTVIVLCVATYAEASTYYVRVTGNDSASGTEDDEAFRTIRHAAQVASADDVVYVGAGAYADNIDVQNKVAGTGPLRIVADTDGTHTGDPGTVIISVGACLLVENSQNIQFEGFDFQGPTDEFVIWRASSGSILGCRFFDGTLPLKVESGTLTLDGCEIARALTDGMRIFADSAVTIRNCTVSQSQESGIEVNLDAQVTIEDSVSSDNSQKGVRILSLTTGAAGTGQTTIRRCKFSGNNYGLRTEEPQTVYAEDSTFADNSWGAYLTSNATFVNCAFDNNPAGGFWLDNMGTNELALTNVTMTGTSGYALYAENSTLTFNASSLAGVTMSGFPIVFGLYNSNVTFDGVTVGPGSNAAIQASLGQLTVRNSTITSGGYGLHCTASTVLVSKCLMSAPYGVFADQCQSVSLDASRFNSTGSGTNDWGVHCTGGDLNVGNCVVDSFRNGIYYSTAVGSDVAWIIHTTVARAGYYGLYLTGTDVRVQNSIIAGTNAEYGLVQGGAQLVHSHNLLHGFLTAFVGTTPDETELLKTPRFADEASGDLHLASGSPAINAGVDLSLTIDAEDNPRPSFRGFEMGAYEYMQANGSLRILTWTEL